MRLAVKRAKPRHLLALHYVTVFVLALGRGLESLRSFFIFCNLLCLLLPPIFEAVKCDL